MAHPAVADQQTAIWLGVALSVAGALLLYDAFERRGASRPFWTRLLPS